MLQDLPLELDRIGGRVQPELVAQERSQPGEARESVGLAAAVVLRRIAGPTSSSRKGFSSTCLCTSSTTA